MTFLVPYVAFTHTSAYPVSVLCIDMSQWRDRTWEAGRMLQRALAALGY